MKKLIQALKIVSFGALLVGVALLASPHHKVAVASTLDATCEASPSPTVYTGSTLNTNTPIKSGVVWNSSSSQLQLAPVGGTFTNTSLGISSSDLKAVCSGDFDGDGWTDIIATSDGSSSYIRYYRNETGSNAAPSPWISTSVRTPKFVVGGDVPASGTAAATCPGTTCAVGPASCTKDSDCTGKAAPSQPYCDLQSGDATYKKCVNVWPAQANALSNLVCGDFNGDGKMDFALIRCTDSSTCDDPGGPVSNAEMFLGNGDGTFKTPYQFVNNLATFSTLNWWGVTSEANLDYNKDNRMDMIWALGSPTTSAGASCVSDASCGTLGYCNPANNKCFQQAAATSGNVVTDSSLWEFLNTPCTSSGANACGATVTWVGGNTSGTGQVQTTGTSTTTGNPMFDTKHLLMATMSVTASSNPSRVAAIGIADFTSDGFPDLVAGGPKTTSIQLFPGLSGGGFSTTAQNFTGTGSSKFNGGAVAILPADYSLDGKIDLTVGTDGLIGSPNGGWEYYFQNNATTTPFSAGATQSSHVSSSSGDLDTGIVLDYDHDPQNTPDFLLADGNDSAAYYLFINHTVNKYVSCGTVTSTPLALGTLSSTELTVADVRIEPTPIPSAEPTGTAVTWQASNNNGTTWVNATVCSDNAAQYCATFGGSIGSQILWRATMCSDTATNTVSPTITGVTTVFDYVSASNHFRAGAVEREGIIYVGAFREPGDEGHVFAIDDSSGATVWDATTNLDAEATSSRHIYTMTSGKVQMAFSTSNASNTTFQATLNTASTTVATNIVNWITSKRFGLSALHVMGAVENSTAAVLSVPVTPYWYSYTATTGSDRTAVNTFISAYAHRQELVFVGSLDGALHAYYTDPQNTSDTNNGKEAWAFVPYDIAQRMLADYTANGSPTTLPVANTVSPAAFPDGAPTLADAKINGAWKTVLVMGEGNGGSSVFALDVTDTVPSAGVVGPTPLWTFTDSNMGLTYSKPTIIRTKVSGTETFMAIFASGPSGVTGIDKGDSLYALDLSTGTLLWRFDLGDTNCYFSSDITAAETADESGTAIDGYIDRVIVGDSKGRIWKLDPGNFNATTHTISPVNSTVNVGLTPLALFSTASSALGTSVPISGDIVAAEDSTNKLTLFFGTGATNAQNALFAVYVYNGQVRSLIDTSAALPVGMAISGVLYNAGQLIVTEDSTTGGLCSSTGVITAYDANTFTQQFQTQTASSIMSPAFAQNGELYMVTLVGSVVTTQYTGTTANGTGTTGGSGGSGGSGGGSGGSGGSGGGSGTGSETQPFTLVGWHQVL